MLITPSINKRLTHMKYSDTCLREVILLRNLFFKVQTLKSYEVHKAKRKLTLFRMQLFISRSWNMYQSLLLSLIQSICPATANKNDYLYYIRHIKYNLRYISLKLANLILQKTRQMHVHVCSNNCEIFYHDLFVFFDLWVSIGNSLQVSLHTYS